MLIVCVSQRKSRQRSRQSGLCCGSCGQRAFALTIRLSNKAFKSDVGAEWSLRWDWGLMRHGDSGEWAETNENKVVIDT